MSSLTRVRSIPKKLRSVSKKLTYLQLAAASFLLGFVCAMLNSLESISPADNMTPQGSGVYVSIGSYQWMGRWRSYQEEKKELLSIIDQLKGSTAFHSERKTTGETSDIIGIWIEITWANAVAFAICLLLSVPLLFSSQITRIVLNIGQYGTYRPVHFGIWRRRYGYVQYRISRYTQKAKNFTTATPDSSDVSFNTPVSDTPISGFHGAPRRKIQEQELAHKGRRIGIEDLQGNFGRTRQDAAARLGVSVSTLKRRCRQHGIMKWPGPIGSAGSDLLQEFFDGEINLGTENDSIAETSETPTLRDSSIRQCSYMDFSSPSIPIESEGVRGSYERTVQVRDQSAMSTVYQTPNPLVFVEPRVALTQMASENMGGSDDGRTSLALQAQQDTCFLIKAMHGDTKLLFLFLLTSGIIGLKEEVSKRLKIEVDSFDVKYEDHEGDLISIACDDDLMFYLNVFRPLGNQVFKLFVISKTPN